MYITQTIIIPTTSCKNAFQVNPTRLTPLGWSSSDLHRGNKSHTRDYWSGTWESTPFLMQSDPSIPIKQPPCSDSDDRNNCSERSRERSHRTTLNCSHKTTKLEREATNITHISTHHFSHRGRVYRYISVRIVLYHHILLWHQAWWDSALHFQS